MTGTADEDGHEAPPSVLVVGHGPVAAAVAREIASAADGTVVVHRADGVGPAAALVASAAGTA
ncbi:MAG TPA: hypothetical protein GX694_08970, partial [Actinomycetales bacterium]|nr:hypothetical protein [Actinomycetales bacterium]